MTRDLKVGLAAVGAVVGLMGWSVAGGIANRPAITRAPTTAAPAMVTQPATPEHPKVAHSAPIAADAAGPASKAPCCKEGAKHGEHHADCKMKGAPAAAPTPAGDASRCPYLKGQAAANGDTAPGRN